MTAVVVAAAILRTGAVLAAQRSHPASAAGRWELPGGRVEPGESDQAALRRECHEELGITITVGAPLHRDIPLRPNLILRAYLATLTPPDATPVAHEHTALRWLTGGTLDSVEWLPADRELLPALRKALGDQL
ncbi:MAG TPA: (deoxy)nucleoside triphosphate pyrophosphohydrolase [Actinophytocola sp.]|uniref:(deoxy)nucleoside triphosphate pyrophosphohydrolase n=1 Tax=Actinophytocola sp. TaxID=1872138 RepID=UPI002DBBEA97|nr:(deoxy)nucleoside triphosphate pyrophosphohydrolase [Actinophytocola sp.]HEU5472089.1 (deoxy)nucleoside triphosphate pyrophosphohydrolase [Actinophytocola sp.]